MLRGFRWQFIALVLAIILFAISLLSRSSSGTQIGSPTLPASDAPTAAAAIATETPITEALTPETTVNTPLPVTNSGDGVVTYSEALIGGVQRLNPLFASLNPVDKDITSLIFEGLTRIDEYGEPVPNLALNWVVSSDELEYVVRLRQDVLWQDGVPFSAADVIYTMSILRSPDFPGLPALGAFWRTVEAEQLSSDLIRFRLTQPLGSFLDALSIGILPEHVLRGTGAAQLATHPFNLSPIGTGPYQLEALRSANGVTIQQVDLRVAPVYRQRPEGQSGYALERVTFRLYDTFDAARQALQNGEVLGLAARNRSERLPLLTLVSVNPLTTIEPTLGILLFNWDRPFFRVERVRQGLEIGLNRQSIIERQLANIAVIADSPLLPGSWAYAANLPWPSYNPDTARSELAQARIPSAAATAEPTVDPAATIDPNFTPAPSAVPSTLLFSFNILTPDDPVLIAIATEIASQWSQYNIAVSVEAVDSATYQTRLDAGDFDTVLTELPMGYSADPDVYAFWHQGQYPDGRNYGNVNDRHISELLERARQTYNGINRIQLYAEFQQDFVQSAVALPLYYPLYTYAVSTRVNGVQLGGFIASPADRFRTIQDWVLAG
ncbi:MAG: ABC transporter substrate-binding protein [Anaerolineae bacterium]